MKILLHDATGNKIGGHDLPKVLDGPDRVTPDGIIWSGRFFVLSKGGGSGDTSAEYHEGELVHLQPGDIQP